MLAFSNSRVSPHIMIPPSSPGLSHLEPRPLAEVLFAHPDFTRDLGETTPVRTALVRLVAEGLIETEAGRSVIEINAHILREQLSRMRRYMP